MAIEWARITVHYSLAMILLIKSSVIDIPVLFCRCENKTERDWHGKEEQGVL